MTTQFYAERTMNTLFFGINTGKRVTNAANERIYIPIRRTLN
jgi:hypothetical protein